MSAKIVEQPAQVRCYQCGKPSVEGICHHCGRPMCREHIQRLPTGKSAAVTLEFTDLGLGDTDCGELPVHCADHVHILEKPSIASVVWGLLILLAGLLLAFMLFSLEQNPTISLGVSLAGAVIAILGYLRYDHQRKANADQRPDLPVLPHLGTIRVRETLSATITLDRNGIYSVQTTPATGLMQFSGSFGRTERERVEKYLRKFRLDSTNGLRFQAGFAVLKGAAGLKLLRNEVNSNDLGVIRFAGTVDDQPILSGTAGRGTGEWNVTRPYQVLASMLPSEPQVFPIRIAPSLAPESARRTLDLELMWPDVLPRNGGPEMHRIEVLELRVPTAWGHVQAGVAGARLSMTGSTTADGSSYRTITWSQVIPSAEERAQRRKTFALQFENEIDATDNLEGRVELSFRGALSHLEGVDLYFPLGTPRTGETTDIETRVAANFRLEMASLCYQDTRVVPDPSRESDVERLTTLTFPGVIPDHVTVIALTSAISNANFYVKRVIENPPRTGERANVVNRYWDVAGRRYIGVYPIDFHLVLSGEEVYSGDIRAQAGTTKTTLTVQGVYSNPEMERQIEGVWDQLTALISDTLTPLAQAAPVSSKIEVPVPAPSTAAPPTVGVEIGMPPPVVPPPVPSTAQDRVELLRQRIERLLDALLDGRITEATYERLRAQFEQELQVLQQTIQ